MSKEISLNEYFFNELKNIQNNITNKVGLINDYPTDDICLISQEPLDSTFIELKCGHKFNYIPLYNDIKLHKLKYNNVESYKLKYNEIRCPYCKIIHDELLPYNSICGDPPTFGVNSPLHNVNEEDSHAANKVLNPKQCTAILLKGKNKGKQCCNNKTLLSYQYCARHYKKYIIN